MDYEAAFDVRLDGGEWKTRRGKQKEEGRGGRMGGTGGRDRGAGGRCVRWGGGTEETRPSKPPRRAGDAVPMDGVIQ
jgi:hypothetical protein